ncbi:MAG: phosphoserine phosphatase SerB [Candidatus Puniceispirillaceae bacterium]
MHYALVFSTSKVKAANQSASQWLDEFAESFAFLNPQNDPAWLAPNIAAEITCLAGDDVLSRDILQNRAFLNLRQHADAGGIDVNLVPSDNRRKAILIADMDSTIITSESLDELAILAGIGEQVTDITRRSMAGELDFETALDERVAMLAGKPKGLIDQIIADSKLTDGARILVQTMRAHGAFCYLVSGGFDVLTGPIAAECGFHGHHANHLDHDGTSITGSVRKPVLDRQAKVTYLKHYCQLHNVDLAATASIGDGANDLGMLEQAGFGVAFHGKPILRETVALQLNHTNLTGLLYLQGYKLDEFVCGD